MNVPMPDERLDGVLRELAGARGEEVAAAALEPTVFAQRVLKTVDAQAQPWMIPPARTMRTLRLAVALGLLIIALLAGLALVGSLTPDPDQLVRLSQAAHENPPPFTMTIRSNINLCPVAKPGETTFRYLYDGHGALRKECLIDGVASDYWVTNASLEGYGSGTTWSYGPTKRDPGIPLSTVDWLNWVTVGEPVSRGPGVFGRPAECVEWKLGPIDRVAGRPARVVSCFRDRYWIDEETHLLLKVDMADTLVETVEIELGAVPPSAMFEIESRTGVRRALVEGQIPPPWVIPLVGGGSFDVVSLRGRPAAVLLRQHVCRSGPCLHLADFVSVVEARAHSLNAAAILWSPGSTDLAVATAASIPVVLDDRAVAEGWELTEGAPRVALFDADGRVVRIIDPRSADSLGAILDAFLAGAAMPDPPAGDGVFQVGQPAPPLKAAVLGGGVVDLATLRGKPVVVLSPTMSTREMAGQLIRFAQATPIVGREATFVAIAWADDFTGSPPPEWKTDVLDRARLRVGPTVDDIVVIEGRPDSDWATLRDVGGHDNSPGPTIVVIDASGLVVDVLWGDTLPDGFELASIVRTVIDHQR